ncbi:MAG: hypothetical protein FMNOHCHN_00994 [Ignavibacteriaceae bacterium]|nr:hypothetical protein [Ignavibacteriaceae bacterium]
MLYEIIFWSVFFVIVYTYAGYALAAVIIAKIPLFRKSFFLPRNRRESVVSQENPYEPKVTLIISAFAESREIIREKIRNTFALNYPKEKLEIYFAIALDKRGDTDETLDEYFRYFMESGVSTGLKSKTEELLSRFTILDAEGKPDIEALNRVIALLEAVEADTTQIDLDYKKQLEDMAAGRDLRWFVTKDVERKGKISQVNRTVKKAIGEILVFSDANSMFNSDSIKNLVRHFADSQVGCVAGEKRIRKNENSSSGEGEGFYWKYESFLKKIDSQIYSTMGAAGEIYAVRRNLMERGVPENAIIEDFVLSMKLVEDGYRIVYEPEAYAEEDPTVTITDEYKRRARISAGGFQSIVLLRKLLNLFSYRMASFQYISHRVLRWAVVPFLLPALFILNLFLLDNPVYLVLMVLQVIFYLLGAGGYVLEKRHKKIRIFNIVYMFLMMNFSAYAGLKRFLSGKQSTLWEKAARVS